LRCIFFDVDGVLVHGYHARPERRRRWDEHIEADLGIDPDAFRNCFFKGAFEKEVLTGRTALMSALADVLPGLGFCGSPLTLINYWMARDSNVNHQLLDIVRQLRRSERAKLFVATNQEHMRALHLWSGLGFQYVFDDIFYSARLGVLKPDGAFFRRIVELVGPQKEAPLLFDDSAAVIEAAKSFGWGAVLYDEVVDCSSHPWVSSVLQANREVGVEPQRDGGYP
jgi:putative hydrolase of the HAD superfamily